MKRLSWQILFVFLLLILVLSVRDCYAQGVRVDPSPVLNTQSLGIGGVTVTLCTGNATTSTTGCSPQTQAFTDITTATPCTLGSPVTLANTNTCQGTTDGSGNFGFWLSPGAYIYCLSGSGVTTQCYNLTVPVGSTSGGTITAMTIGAGGTIGLQRNGAPPNLVDVGISHCSGAGTLCIGNGTAADGSGSLTAGAVNVTGNTNGDTALKVTPGVAGLTNSSFVQIEPNSTIVGSGPQNGQPNTPQGWYRSLVGTSGLGAEAGQFAISVPSGYVGGIGIANQINALGSYIWTQDPNHYALANSSFAVCDATGAFCWGANPVVTTYAGNPGHTGQQLHGIEVDCEAQTTGVTIQCIQAGAPGSTQNPSVANAFDIAAPAWPNGHWSTGLTIETGATGTNPGIKLAPVASGASQNSQNINFVGTNGASANVSANIQADANGDLVIIPTAGANLRISTASAGVQLESSAGGNFTTVSAPNATTARSITWPDLSGVAALSNAAQTWSGNQTNMPLVTPTIGGDTITHVPEMAANAFAASISGVTTLAPLVLPTNAITITRFTVTQNTPPAGCGTFPVVSVFDNTGAAILTSLTLAASPSTIDSGSISIAVTAGHDLYIRTTTAAVTCSPNAANVAFRVMYKMQ